MTFPAGRMFMQGVQMMDKLSNQAIGVSDEDSFPSIMFNFYSVDV